MINRIVIKVFPSENGFAIEGFPNSNFDIKNLLLNTESVLSSNIEKNIVNVTTIRRTVQENLILSGLLALKYLESLYNVSISCSFDESSHFNEISFKCVCDNVPAGLGEPCFDKFHAVLCKELLKIDNAIGFEIGMGFSASFIRGSQHNDPFVLENNKIHTVSNHAGGVLGGITNGSQVYFSVIFSNNTDNAENLIKSITAIIILDFIIVQRVKQHN